MPHKRAKKSARDQQKSSQGNDLAPEKQSLSNERIPKAIARVLNASSIRQDWKNKRKHAEDDGTQKKKKRRVEEAKKDGKLKILPGESLAHFNRRVEDNMRPLVRTAMATSSAAERKAKKNALQQKVESTKGDAAKKKHTVASSTSDAEEETITSHPGHKTAKPALASHVQPTTSSKPSDFATLSSSAPRRLNDIAQAPPSLKLLKSRKTDASQPIGRKSDAVVSMAQKAMMEQERERAIQRYRDLKEKRLQERSDIGTSKDSG